MWSLDTLNHINQTCVQLAREGKPERDALDQVAPLMVDTRTEAPEVYVLMGQHEFADGTDAILGVYADEHAAVQAAQAAMTYEPPHFTAFDYVSLRAFRVGSNIGRDVGTYFPQEAATAVAS